MRRDGRRAHGNVLVAERADGIIWVFADVSASSWLRRDRVFRLPAESADLQRFATTGRGADGQPRAGVELRRYVSNCVVDASCRRRGGGRRSMAACEEAASSWVCVGAAVRSFYESLGYVENSCTAGNEGIRGGDGGFRLAEVGRCILRKDLRL